MRVNYDTESVCDECGLKYGSTEVMHDLFLVDNCYTLCYDCIDKIFHKVLKAQCNWNAKTKDKADMQRIRVASNRKNPKIEEKDITPECYGNFVKQQKCKKCSVNKQCKDIWQNSGWDDYDEA